jgi:SNF2 family DNA or RNA helicase
MVRPVSTIFGAYALRLDSQTDINKIGQELKMKYDEFIKSKKHLSSGMGFNPEFIPDKMFDFQEFATKQISEKGRCAAFIDTGLGKTLIELTIAVNYSKKTDKPVLIMTPLSVAFQFIEEAKKFGIDDIEYSRDGKYDSRIVICNYERLDKFNSEDFDCVILDESSILKNFQGSIKTQVTSFMKNIKYRFLFTATPSPNDFIELGTSSEALGHMGHTDMLTRFFTNNEDTISPQSIGTKWILKGHATNSFFEWVSGWSVSMRKPSDLGFSDDLHILPDLTINDHKIKNHSAMVIDDQIMMFNPQARRLPEVRQENKLTINGRCEKAVELASKHDYSVYWCNLNPEAELIGKLDKDSYEIKGSMNIDKKEEILYGFYKGEIKKLVTKYKITSFGLNWQHCNHTVLFPTFSFEQYYQAIRRFWRFGQKKPVLVDRVISDGQQRVLDSIEAKGIKATELFKKLNLNINADYTERKVNTTNLVKPSFIGVKK